MDGVADARVVRTGAHMVLVLGVQVSHHHLPVVEVREVRHDDGDGQSEGQDTSNGTQGADHLSPEGKRHHVSVPDRSHGHQSPPEGSGNGLEVRSLVSRLCIVNSRGEEDDTNQQEEDLRTRRDRSQDIY